MATCWVKDHPQVVRIRSFQFNNPLQENAVINAYFDLTEVKKWYHVSVESCTDLQLVYLIGQQTESSQRSSLVPLPASTPLTMTLIQRLFQAICQPPAGQTTTKGTLTTVQSEQQQAEQQAKLTLGLVDKEGAVTYYHLQQGVCPADNKLRT